MITYVLLAMFSLYFFYINTDLKINKKIKWSYYGLYIGGFLSYLLLNTWGLSVYWKLIPLLFQVVVLLVVVFAYNKNPMKEQYLWIVTVFIGYVISMCTPTNIVVVTYMNVCLLSTLHHKQRLKKETWCVILLLCGIQYFFVDSYYVIFLSGMLCFGMIFYMNDMQNNVEKSIEAIQKHLIVSQYGEVKEMYMDMRGWRHDYHNHIQIMKAYVQMGQLEQLKDYFDSLEQNLEEVNQLVKTDNLMVDAILNGKVSLMKKHKIAVDITAKLPEHLWISDVDLCVIIGNLLDNAIETCLKIEEKKRYIRIYIAVKKEQFYLSIQNSAKEELSKEERQYITNKRGEHGFGRKRVKALVDKYGGYLNMQNESGIFASEVSIPMDN